MSSDYFDSSSHQQIAGARARASSINAALDAIDVGLALLPDEDEIKEGLINYGTDTGAADAYVVALPYTPSGYTDGLQVVFKASGTNTGTCTINLNSLGVKTIRRQDGSVPLAGDIAINKLVELRYNATSGYMELQGGIGAAAGTGTMALQNASSVSITGGSITGLTSQYLSGYRVRSQMTWKDADEIYIGPGVYEVNGVVAKITSTLTSPAISSGGTDWHYLYIDHSAIPTDGVIDNGDMYWSTSEPVEDGTNLAWFHPTSSYDRCIFAVYTSSDAILEFWHNDNYVTFGQTVDVQAATNYNTTFTDCPAFRVPIFCYSVDANIRLDANGDIGSAYAYYRPNGSSTSAGSALGRCIQDTDTEYSSYYVRRRLILGTGSLIEMKYSSSGNHTIAVDQIGWYLPSKI